jgi:hypothetical protein
MCYNPDKLHGIKWVFQSKLKMNCYRTVDKNSTTGVTSGAGTAKEHPGELLRNNPETEVFI